METRFNPNTGAQIIRLKKQFANLSLQPQQDPGLWMMDVEELQTKVDPGMTEKDLIIHMMSHLPASYDETVTLLSMRLCSTNDPLDLQTFRQILCDRYDRQTQRDGDKNNVALVAENKNKNKNSKNKKKKKNRNDKVCSHCDKIGHLVDKCWIKNPDLPHFKCEYCDFESGYKSNLNKHIKCHSRPDETRPVKLA